MQSVSCMAILKDIVEDYAMTWKNGQTMSWKQSHLISRIPFL